MEVYTLSIVSLLVSLPLLINFKLKFTRKRDVPGIQLPLEGKPSETREQCFVVITINQEEPSTDS
jgi:hypothetical protein